MTEEMKANRKARVMVLAGLLLVVGSLVAVPTASAATVHPGGGGCTGSLVGDLGNNPTWENLFGDVGRFIDCVS